MCSLGRSRKPLDVQSLAITHLHKGVEALAAARPFHGTNRITPRPAVIPQQIVTVPLSIGELPYEPPCISADTASLVTCRRPPPPQELPHANECRSSRI